jgi:hypothetical protein
MVPLKSQPVASEFRIRVRKYRSIIKFTNETTYLVLQPPSPPFPNTFGSSGALSQLISGSGGSRDREKGSEEAGRGRGGAIWCGGCGPSSSMQRFR